MGIVTVDKDLASRTMTMVAEFDAPVARVWEIWNDPRQLERWWGPPTYPATVVDHDLTPGGTVRYFMTGPEGDKHNGWWRIIAVDPPRHLAFEDGFGDDPAHAAPDMPTTSMRVRLAERAGGGTRMEVVSNFPSTQAMEQLLAMGMEEGMTAAVGQIDAILASAPA